MYFKPDLSKAIQAGQELAKLVLTGQLVEQRHIALDAAFFTAGTINAYLSPPIPPTDPTPPGDFTDLLPNPDPTTTSSSNPDSLTIEELAAAVSPDEPTTSGIPLSMILLLAKKIICSL